MAMVSPEYNAGHLNQVSLLLVIYSLDWVLSAPKIKAASMQMYIHAQTVSSTVSLNQLESPIFQLQTN